MKIAVSSYSFQALIQAGAMTQLDCVQAAKHLGFDAVEFIGLQPHDNSEPMEYAGRIREESERCGLPVSNYTIAADFLTGSGGDLQREIERLYGEVDMAVRLGSHSMRHDASGGYLAGQRSWRGFEQALPRLAEGCRKVTEYAVQQGVRTMVENHGFFCQDSDRVEKLINTVAHDNFGWLVDMGNFLCADEDPAKAVGRAAPYAFYVHGKDFLVRSGMEPDPGSGFFRSRSGAYLRGTVIGHGNVPVRQCLAALKGAGYDGYIGLEFEGVEPTEWALRTGLENLRRAIEAI